MTQVRLNSAAVCHVHKERVDNVAAINVAVDFASRSDTRRATFGNFELAI